MLTLLQIVSTFARRQGIKVPSTVVTSTDETILQVWGLLDEEVTELADRKDWFWLRSRGSFQHAGAADYRAYNLGSLADYKGFIPETLYASDQRLPVAGPASPPQWAQMMALSQAPAMYTYRIYGGWVYIYPQPTVLSSVTYTFEYLSAYPVLASDGSTTKPLFTADDDTPRLPDRIVLAGLRWRWKKEKNQAYAEELRAYESLLEAEAGRETLPTDLHMDSPDPDSRVAAPGLLIPAGNWSV